MYWNLSVQSSPKTICTSLGAHKGLLLNEKFSTEILNVLFREVGGSYTATIVFVRYDQIEAIPAARFNELMKPFIKVVSQKMLNGAVKAKLAHAIVNSDIVGYSLARSLFGSYFSLYVDDFGRFRSNQLSRGNYMAFCSVTDWRASEKKEILESISREIIDAGFFLSENQLELLFNHGGR